MSLASRISDLITVLATDYKTVMSKIGNTDALTTTAKNTVGAVNEVRSDISSLRNITLDTDINLSSDSDAKVASQHAVKTYTDSVRTYAQNLIAANDAQVIKGGIDASTNPNYPAADAGHTYRITAQGKIGGAAGVNVEVGDTLICFVDGSPAGTQAAVGARWTIIQTNIDGAVTGPANSVSGNLAFFSGTTGKVVGDSGVSVDTDGTLGANSDSRLATQKAVVTYAVKKDDVGATETDLVAAYNSKKNA